MIVIIIIIIIIIITIIIIVVVVVVVVVSIRLRPGRMIAFTFVRAIFRGNSSRPLQHSYVRLLHFNFQRQLLQRCSASTLY